MKILKLLLLFVFTVISRSMGQDKPGDIVLLLKPDRVFDGQQIHNGWWVLIKGNHIEASGEPASIKAPSSAKIIELKGMTLMPGMIEGHSHLFLHP
jgi:imidazolonepropionase-like amidohydrolase